MKVRVVLAIVLTFVFTSIARSQEPAAWLLSSRQYRVEFGVAQA
jgi:hypothetical protein